MKNEAAHMAAFRRELDAALLEFARVQLQVEAAAARLPHQPDACAELTAAMLGEEPARQHVHQVLAKFLRPRFNAARAAARAELDRLDDRNAA